ncbi:hypothetical protein VNO78_31841 [Psophocarpus tetragonolobus]|uniref:RIN4 pathogenic type III effector avirulence factor Avr cleavage site domain-containing protein n=1 Tax=Psophocarpus tetragonolobus TaxID=3891 RepID=A0AAN9RZG2_PSOTE
MSVPQFGGWDQNTSGVTYYTMVFNQARANKKHKKTYLTAIRRNSFGSEKGFINVNHDQALHHHGYANHDPVHAHEDHVIMGKKRFLTYINCCIKPTIATT